MRTLTWVAGGVVLVLALGACGLPTGTASTAADGKAAQLAQSLAAKTGQAKSSRFSYDLSAAGQHITGTGEGRYSGSDSALTTTMSVGGQPEQVRIVDQAVYVKLPAAYAYLSGGKTWVKASADSETSAVISSSLDAAELADPSKLIAHLQQSGKVTNSEKTTLNGQQVTRYTVDLDANAAGELGLTGLSGKAKSISVELWIDNDGLPVQITENFTGIVSESITIDYRDWGIAVDVQAPPADEVGQLG